MATGTRLMQEISDQFLNCKICFENFRDPKTLSCLHTFCCTCLQNQYDQEVNSRTTRYAISIYNRQVTCPLCRKKTDLPTGGVKRLPENFLVSNLTEVLAKRTVSKIPPCEICSTVRGKNIDACSKCLDCSKILCRACVDLHLSTKVTQQHSLIDLEGEKDIQCKAHPDESVRFYCEPCDACICVVCAFQEHKDHEVCSFSDGSAKSRTSLESLVGRCRERLGHVSSRLNAIEKYETCVKDVKERIRDLAINYISQVRAKEKELMQRIEEEYGGEIKEFVDHKQTLQENMDELQSACNLTDIMLKDKSLELLLIKKDIESKMTQLLQPVLPDPPSDPKYDVRFVPGNVVLGRLSFGEDPLSMDNTSDKEDLMRMKSKLGYVDVSEGCMPQTNDPDVINDTTLTDKGGTKEMSTSMLSDMRGGITHTNSQTEAESLISRDTSTNLVETKERGVFAMAYDMKARGTMTDRSDVRSFKCQTEMTSSDKPSSEIVLNSAEQSNRPEYTGTTSSLFTSSTLATSPSPSSYSEASSVRRGNREAAAIAALTTRPQSTTAELHQSSSVGDCRPAPDLLPTSAALGAYVYSPSRRIRSIKIQTEISALDVEAVASSADTDFVKNIVQSQIFAEKLRQEKEKAASRFLYRDRPRRVRTTNTEGITVSNESAASEKAGTFSERRQSQSENVQKACTLTNTDTQTELVEHDDSSTCTDNESLIVKTTSTQSIVMDDKETCTPTTKFESKVTWTDMLSTSERATATVTTESFDCSTGTVPVKTGDAGVQIKPYAKTIATNTTVITSSDQDSQTSAETTEQGTMPDLEIQLQYERKEKELAKESEVLDTSVDFITPPQSPAKRTVTTVDRATDPIKTPCFTKATETVQIKMVTSSTETPVKKYVEKDTATSEIKSIDQWTETAVPQLISTGVTPPVPATIDVGVATNVVLTDEQATSTDVKAYRDSHTETVVVLCDNETLTEVITYIDAQTGVDISTDNQECETEQLDNADESCMTDNYNSSETVKGETLPRDSRASRRRKRAQEVQTTLTSAICGTCGHINDENGQCSSLETTTSARLEIRSAEELQRILGKEFKDSSTMPCFSDTQDVGTMAISCVTCLHDFQETAIQTTQPILYDKSSATSFETDLDFLERTLSRDYHDAATSTESLPYIGLLSEIDVDELIVVPEAAFELVSDTDSEYDLIMVDDETSTDFLQSVEVGTQTFVLHEDGTAPMDVSASSMTESTNSKSVGEVIKSMVQSHGCNPDNAPEGSLSKHLVSIGINTIPKLTFEKETCTPIRHLFSKGTMTFYVSKMDKSTSTLNQARIMTGSSLAKTKSADKITMTAKAEKKDVGVETEAAAMDGRITKCISKLRSVSEKLNSPPAKKAVDSENFFGTNFSPSKVAPAACDKLGATNGVCALDSPEEERQRQLKTLLEQTNALLICKDRSPNRKPQPITTLKGRIPATVDNNAPTSYQTLKPESRYDSKSLPRGFPSDRPGTVRMGSQPLSPSRLPLLRYNSAPGRIATVPTQTLLIKSGQITPAVSPSASPRMSPSKIPVSKKPSPPEFQARLPQQMQQQQQQQPHQSMDGLTQEPLSAIPPLRRPLPSITETRTPSSCSDSSTTSYMSAESNASVGQSSNRLSKDAAALSIVLNKLSTESTPLDSSSKQSSRDTTTALATASNPIAVGPAEAQSRSSSTSTTLSVTSASMSDSVFKKSSSDISNNADSSDTLEDKPPAEDKSLPTPPKKSSMGFMQRLLSRKKKAPEAKKEPVSVIKSGPPTAAAVAALASAAPPMPAPPPESYAHTPLQLPPPHHYPPLPEHSSPALPRKPRPFVYVQQRIVSIQQDNVEEMTDRKMKPDDQKLDEGKEEQASGKDKRKEKEKPPEKQKDKSKKESQAEKGKKKKEEKEKGKVKRG